MQYCTDLDSPQSCVMDINGAGEGSIDTVPGIDHSVKDSLLHLNVAETSQPYFHEERYIPSHGCPLDRIVRQGTRSGKGSAPCYPEILNRTPTWPVPSYPGLDFLSRSPGASWSSSGLGNRYMGQNASAPMSLCSSWTNYSVDGVRVVKRPSRPVEPTALQHELKKSRSIPSHPILKVRKEKLGDRIAALQQLVAPYGKTDTASVLSESIGYIKFLQDQIEALSSPYMKRSHAWTQEISNEVLIRDQGHGVSSVEGNGDTDQLRSRGLCLVPLSCLSHIDFDNCGGSVFNWQSIPKGTLMN